jgi:Periplasmic copper-binding protein (NosD)
MTNRYRVRLTRTAVACSVALLGALVLSAPAAAHGFGHHRVYVSPNGSADNSGVSCQHAKYSSINDGIAAAPNHGVVIVCPGTYAEMVAVNKPITLEGHHAVIDATGLNNGVLITSSWATVERLTVKNAIGEGILAMGAPGTPIMHVTIQRNKVLDNNTGASDPLTTYTECQPAGQIPGDCGEGIHLMVVAQSTVRQNVVQGNLGGILLTDEFGPTYGNKIIGNLIQDNPYDCGITLAGHGLGWTGSATSPATGGVYDNLVRGNVVRRNGLLGEGAGVLMAAAWEGAAVYDNHVDHNVIMGNNLAGVTIHSHPASDVNPVGGYVGGNSITHNLIGQNNVGGDPDAGVADTTGVLVYSSGQPTTVTISHNVILHNHFGIWLSPTTVTATLQHNVFLHDDINVGP